MIWIRRASVFVGSLILYLLCLDSGASLWDCPEYILTAWRLEIGHPPGNPTWQLIANVVAHLGGNAGHAAVIINGLSAIAMALASLFLSGVIYILLRGSLLKGEGDKAAFWANVCAGCGALCYAWCDSAIFSAVEAEVYALSAMFTSLMLWIALQWAIAWRNGEKARAWRLIALTSYLAGLGAGVHELNFLIIPALLLIYWYGTRGDGRHGRSYISRAGIQTFLTSIPLFIIGISTFLIIPIRAAANPPINQGNPSNLQRFLSYYTREQYGSKPFFYGRTPYSKPLRMEQYDSVTGSWDYSSFYLTEDAKGKKRYVYPEELDMWFPRMTSPDPEDIRFYEAWAGMTPEEMEAVWVKTAVDSAGTQIAAVDPVTGKRMAQKYFKPTYTQQLRYLLGYQTGYMYMRYLLWNFGGRQNNLPSTGGLDTGNFITGVSAIDNAMLGPQGLLPPSKREANKGYNRYFMLPFLFGIIGIIALARAGKSGRRILWIVLLFFLFTGILIAVYLNQDPGEPRERDYSFLGSYMAFSIWIGCGMAALVKPLMRLRRCWITTISGLLICFSMPALILSQTYDDHNRSAQTGAEEIGKKILNPLPENAIIIARGDNTIFPLWYCQEVLGIRRDVTVVAQPYLVTDWYREQLRIPGEESLPVNISEPIPGGPAPFINRVIEDIRRQNPKRPVIER